MDEDFNTDDITPEEAAEIKRNMQDAEMGLTYKAIFGEDGLFSGDLECDQCGRVGHITERPFPHKFACPMRERVKD